MIPWNKTDFNDGDLLASYCDLFQPVTLIAQRYGCSAPTVYRRLRELCVVRSNSEAHRGQIPHNKRGGYKDSQGYIYVQLQPDDLYTPMASSDRYVRQHRLVMAEHLGRPLKSWEIVHHKNGKKDDNRLENLVAYPSQGDHLSLTRLVSENRRLRRELKQCRAAWKAKQFAREVKRKELDFGEGD